VNQNELTEHGQAFLQSNHAADGLLSELKRPALQATAASADAGATFALSFTISRPLPADGKIIVSGPGLGAGATPDALGDATLTLASSAADWNPDLSLTLAELQASAPYESIRDLVRQKPDIGGTSLATINYDNGGISQVTFDFLPKGASVGINSDNSFGLFFNVPPNGVGADPQQTQPGNAYYGLMNSSPPGLDGSLTVVKHLNTVTMSRGDGATEQAAGVAMSLDITGCSGLGGDYVVYTCATDGTILESTKVSL
jgi:hypothetical protein